MIVPPRKNLSVILNVESGALIKLGPEKVEEGLLGLYKELDVKVQIRKVFGGGVRAALEAAHEDDTDAVVVGGGDGTVASAATILVGKKKPLGILPLGTFNLAARDVGMPLDWLEAARIMVTAPLAEMDLIDVNGNLCMCVVVLGFYPALIMGRAEYHGNWIVKTIRTLWGTLRGLAQFPPLHLRVNDRGLIQDHRTRLVLVANNDYEDIFGIIPKRRGLDAGYFTIYVSKHASGFGLLRAAVLWLFGRWKQDGEIASIRTSQVEIDVRTKRHLLVMMDGETKRISVPFVVKTRAKALRVIAPRLEEEVPAES